jgi:hypothetical protein
MHQAYDEDPVSDASASAPSNTAAPAWPFPTGGTFQGTSASSTGWSQHVTQQPVGAISLHQVIKRQVKLRVSKPTTNTLLELKLEQAITPRELVGFTLLLLSVQASVNATTNGYQLAWLDVIDNLGIAKHFVPVQSAAVDAADIVITLVDPT